MWMGFFGELKETFLHEKTAINKLNGGSEWSITVAADIGRS